MGTLVGVAVPFNVLSQDLGGWFEKIAPSAVERSLHDGTDLRFLFDHDSAKVLARRSARSLRVHAERDGLHFEADLAPTSVGEDLVTLVRAGVVDGASWAFQTVDVEWDRDATGRIIRTVNDMAIRELSAVSWPAYLSTAVSLASRAAPVAPAPRRGGSAMSDPTNDRHVEYAARPGYQRDLAQREFETVTAEWRNAKRGSPRRFRYVAPPMPTRRLADRLRALPGAVERLRDELAAKTARW
jgi:HK97 family phage prohead protease